MRGNCGREHRSTGAALHGQGCAHLAGLIPAPTAPHDTLLLARALSLAPACVRCLTSAGESESVEHSYA